MWKSFDQVTNIPRKSADQSKAGLSTEKLSPKTTSDLALEKKLLNLYFRTKKGNYFTSSYPFVFSTT